MMVLVRISRGIRVGQKLVKVVDALLARLFGQRDRHPHQMPKRLNLMGLLMGERRGPFQDRFRLEGGFSHVRASSAASNTLCSPLQTRFRNRAFPKYATSPDSHTIDSWPLRTHRSLRHAFAIRWPRFTSERSS